jgi:hypothetical protein
MTRQRTLTTVPLVPRGGTRAGHQLVSCSQRPGACAPPLGARWQVSGRRTVTTATPVRGLSGWDRSAMAADTERSHRPGWGYGRSGHGRSSLPGVAVLRLHWPSWGRRRPGASGDLHTSCLSRTGSAEQRTPGPPPSGPRPAADTTTSPASPERRPRQAGPPGWDAGNRSEPATAARPAQSPAPTAGRAPTGRTATTLRRRRTDTEPPTADRAGASARYRPGRWSPPDPAISPPPAPVHRPPGPRPARSGRPPHPPDPPPQGSAPRHPRPWRRAGPRRPATPADPIHSARPHPSTPPATPARSCVDDWRVRDHPTGKGS